jgi:pyruvate dehydrogenase E2 component (dihydrolipoamide acetyltransferase)
MAVPIVMPKLGMVMSEGTIAKWTKAAGTEVKQGEVIAEIETEKINYDLEATEDGLFQPVVDEGDSVPVDGLVGYLLAEGEEAPEPEAAPPAAVATPAATPPPATGARRDGPAKPDGVVKSTPGARRVAAKLGVEVSLVTPSGPGGRVVEDDVRAFAEQAPAPAADARPQPPAGLPEPSETTDLAGMRKSIADHMRGSLADTAQLSFFLEIDVTDAQRMRREASSDGVTITIGDVLGKACIEALKRNPALNTVLTDRKVLRFDQVNLAFAVNLADGLIVPVIKEAEAKNIVELSKASRELAEKAESGSLTPDDVTGGTFTISVLGSVDGFTPILNAGQSAILGVGRSSDQPVVKKGEVVVREMMTVSLTVDHQVVDGAVAAAFLRRLQRLVESPASLFK